MKQSGRELRYTNQYLLQIPKTRLKTYGDAVFSVAGPTKWYRLPWHIRMAPTIECFNLDLKHSIVGPNLICPGRRFHFVGPAALNTASPYVVSLVFGICSRYWFVDRSSRPDCFICTSSRMYCGASPRIALYVISKSLKVIRCLTGNQWRHFNRMLTTCDNK